MYTGAHTQTHELTTWLLNCKFPEVHLPVPIAWSPSDLTCRLPLHTGSSCLLCALSAAPLPRAATAYTETWEIPPGPQGWQLLSGVLLSAAQTALLSDPTKPSEDSFNCTALGGQGPGLPFQDSTNDYAPQLPRADVLILKEGNSTGIDWCPESSSSLSWHQFSDTNWVSWDSIQFWHLLPRVAASTG